jgi:phage baseplate assembly protein W
MAIIDTTKKPYLQDKQSETFIGIKYPFKKSGGVEGWFESSSTTIESVKDDIRMLLSTERGERLMQPRLGLGLRKYLFDQITGDKIQLIKNEIIESFSLWLPFVEIQNIEVSSGSEEIENQKLNVSIIFNINRDPRTLDGVSVTVGA